MCNFAKIKYFQMTASAALQISPSLQKVNADRRFVSLEKYFQREEKALHKSEYHQGNIIKMAGGTYNHNFLSVKITKLLDNFVEENDLNYAISGSDLKIRIEAYDRVVYPDAAVICEKPIFYENRKDTITNPLIIVEVLSESTYKFDKTDKFQFYRSLESFKEYVLISQDYKWVTVYTKQDDGTWVLRDYSGDDAEAILYFLHHFPLPLKRLYRGLEV
jgi:Uma2 family endonuclease